MNRGYNSLAFPRGGHLIGESRVGGDSREDNGPSEALDVRGGRKTGESQRAGGNDEKEAFKTGRPAFSQANVQIRSFACMLIKAKHPGRPSLGGGGGRH